MRRFTSIFKRSDIGSSTDPDSQDKSPLVKTPSRFFRSLSTKQGAKASSARAPVPYSSSSTSSTDSPSPPTPNEDLVAFHSLTKTPWKESPSRKPLPALQIRNPQYPPGVLRTDDSEDDRSSVSSSSRSESTSASIPRSVAPIAYAQSLTSNNLVPTLSVPPFLHLPGNPLFPRSSNSVSSLAYQESPESILHRTSLLRRLERRELTNAEELSLASFARRRFIPTKRIPPIRLDDDAVKDSKRISKSSHGLRIWASRPCFEDRVVIYTPAPPGSPHAVDVNRVTGSVFAVAALEFSSGLEALAGLLDSDPWDEPRTPASATSSSSSLSAPAPAPARIQPYKSNPSPLRTGTLPPSPKKPSPDPVPSMLAGPAVGRAKNTVRFEVDGKEGREDQIPLGQIMRIKRGREEKAKFLELQRERRSHEEERLRHEAERKKWEKEKQAWDAEKRAIEEDKRKKLYAQELVAARKRRESQIYKTGSPSPEIADSGSFTRQQSPPRTYSRPHYDSRRQNSEPGHAHDESPASSRGTSRSRVDSRPPSLHSRPPSLYSTHTRSSAEDVRPWDRRISMNNMVPVPMDPRKDFMMNPHFAQYAWTPVTPVPPVPTMPYMPFYNPNVDHMPLLPPAPPFMMQQHGNRRRSSNSSPSRESLPVSRSAERLPSSGSAKHQTAHQRHSSGEIQESKRISVAARTTSSPTVPSTQDTVSSTKDRKAYARTSSQPPSSARPVVAPPTAYNSLPRSIRRQTTII